MKFRTLRELKTVAVGENRRRMVVYTGAEVFRDDWAIGEHMIRFAIPGMRTPRLAESGGGIPVTKGHWRDPDNVIGTLEFVTAGADGIEAVARFEVSDDPVIRRIDEGILKSVSMEALPLTAPRETTVPGQKMRSFIVDEWELQAVAIVAVGADPSARLLDNETGDGGYLLAHARTQGRPAFVAGPMAALLCA